MIQRNRASQWLRAGKLFNDICNDKIEDLNKKLDTQSSAKNPLPQSFTGNNPLSNQKKNNSKFSKEIKSVSSPLYQYHGNQKNWLDHKKKLLNLIWALSVNQIEAIMAIIMYFAGPAE